MIITDASIAWQNTVNGGGVRPPVFTKSSGSSFNFGDFLNNMVDPFHIFPKIQGTIQKGVDTVDHITGVGLDTASSIADKGAGIATNLADKGGNILDNTASGLESLSKLFSSPTFLVIGAGVVLLVILK